ncbi:THAP domain-containing protein 3-like [Pimephales promelas]|uniref:THAP domain-containing protein 3-like n=1 Tax=Pimephales promelas TaxID=90988 RepID=UPI00195563A0|nr:THAP domain-containing protein 3-like [Pimephales promelas]
MSGNNWKQRTQCSAINCNNYQCTSNELAFHRFPKDPERSARWVQNLRNASLAGISSQRLNQNYRVCSAHFHPSQFKRPSDVHAGLNWNAVPTMVNAPNPPPPPLDIEHKRKPPKTRQELPPKKRQQSHATGPFFEKHSLPDEDAVAGSSSPPPSTDNKAVAGPLLPPPPPLQPDLTDLTKKLYKQIRSLKSQICKLKAKVRNLTRQKTSKLDVKHELKRLLPAKSYAFFSTQLRMCQRKANGFRWTAQDKAFFLSLLHASPKCYRLLCRVFSMPSVRTLQKVIKSPGFKQSILSTD